MQRGQKPKPEHLKLVEGTLRGDRLVALDGPLQEVPQPPEWLNRRAQDVWKRKAAEAPAWSQYQIQLFPAYCLLTAQMETTGSSMSATRMTEHRRLAEILYAPRGLPEAPADDADGYFDD